MPTLIAYSTRHGATRRYAEALAQEWPGQATLRDLRKDAHIDISLFDTVIIGGAVYAGQVQKELRNFCITHMAELKQKRLGLFICCWHEGEPAEKQLQSVFPTELLSLAVATAYLGGELKLEEMNAFERLIIRLVAKVKESDSHYSEEAMRQFAQALWEKHDACR